MKISPTYYPTYDRAIWNMVGGGIKVAFWLPKI